MSGCDGKVDSTFSHPLSGTLGFTGDRKLLTRAERLFGLEARGARGLLGASGHPLWLGTPKVARAHWD